MEEIKQEKSDRATIYEVSYLLLPSLAEAQVPGKAQSLKDSVTSLGGAVISSENPVLIDLAYPMVKVVQTERHKVTEGYFGWIKFEIDSTGIEKVKKAFDGDNDTVRYLIIKTVRENTLLEGKMKLKSEEKFVRGEEEAEGEIVAPKEAASAEEVDKSIDDLVIA